MALYFFTSSNLEWGIISFMLAGIGYSGGLVFYNAWLPEIAPKGMEDRISARGYALGYIGGVVLLVEGNLRVGDIVEIHGSSKSSQKSSDAIVAKILKISVRTTQIQTREGNVLIIPNTRLTQEQIENWSHGSELTRFKINVTVDFGADTELIKRLLVQAAMAHPKVKKNHPVFVSLADFGENGLGLELIFWADHSWDIDIYKSEIRFEIDRLFREYKIAIPYPHRTISQSKLVSE
jgi:small-conductance mechanosensitive channel